MTLKFKRYVGRTKDALQKFKIHRVKDVKKKNKQGIKGWKITLKMKKTVLNYLVMSTNSYGSKCWTVLLQIKKWLSKQNEVLLKNDQNIFDRIWRSFLKLGSFQENRIYKENVANNQKATAKSLHTHNEERQFG